MPVQENGQFTTPKKAQHEAAGSSVGNLLAPLLYPNSFGFKAKLSQPKRLSNKIGEKSKTKRNFSEWSANVRQAASKTSVLK